MDLVIHQDQSVAVCLADPLLNLDLGRLKLFFSDVQIEVDHPDEGVQHDSHLLLTYSTHGIEKCVLFVFIDEEFRC